MARVFNGVTYLNSAELVEHYKKQSGTEDEEQRGNSVAMWRHYARTGKVPAKRWVDGHWYFNPDEVDNALQSNGYNADERNANII